MPNLIMLAVDLNFAPEPVEYKEEICYENKNARTFECPNCNITVQTVEEFGTSIINILLLFI